MKIKTEDTMGFFSNIINSAKAEALKTSDAILDLKLSDACRILSRQLRSANSLPKRVSLM